MPRSRRPETPRLDSRIQAAKTEDLDRTLTAIATELRSRDEDQLLAALGANATVRLLAQASFVLLDSRRDPRIAVQVIYDGRPDPAFGALVTLKAPGIQFEQRGRNLAMLIDSLLEAMQAAGLLDLDNPASPRKDD